MYVIYIYTTSAMILLLKLTSMGIHSHPGLITEGVNMLILLLHVTIDMPILKSSCLRWLNIAMENEPFSSMTYRFEMVIFHSKLFNC